MLVFQKIWRALFPCNTRFEIHPSALLPTIFHIWQDPECVFEYIYSNVVRKKFHVKSSFCVKHECEYYWTYLLLLVLFYLVLCFSIFSF